MYLLFLARTENESSLFHGPLQRNCGMHRPTRQLENRCNMTVCFGQRASARTENGSSPGQKTTPRVFGTRAPAKLWANRCAMTRPSMMRALARMGNGLSHLQVRWCIFGRPRLVSWSADQCAMSAVLLLHILVL